MIHFMDLYLYCSVFLFLCLLLSISDSGFLYTFISDINVSVCACGHVCACMRAMRIWVPTFSVRAVCLYVFTSQPIFKCLPSNFTSTEVWRNNNKGQEGTYKWEVLRCHHHTPQWCERSWLGGHWQAVNHVCQILCHLSLLLPDSQKATLRMEYILMRNLWQLFLTFSMKG